MNKKLVGAVALLALVGCAPVVTRYVDQKDPSIIMAECVQPPKGDGGAIRSPTRRL